MRVTVTGATGRIGTKLVAQLKRARRRGDGPVARSRARRARAGRRGLRLAAGGRAGPGGGARRARRRRPPRGRGRRPALDAPRSSAGSCSRASSGTRNLVEGLRAAEPRPRTLVSAAAVGWYGPHGDELLDEDQPAGSDFLAHVCVVWEREASAAGELGMRVVVLRTPGLVLGQQGGALDTDAPVLQARCRRARGRRASVRALDPPATIWSACISRRSTVTTSWRGPINATAPEPVTNKVFSKALGRALHRPAFAPVPGFALQLLYGEMSTIVINGQRAVPEAHRGARLPLPPPRPRRGAALRARRELIRLRCGASGPSAAARPSSTAIPAWPG